MYKPCSKFEGKFETQKAVFLCNDGLGHPGQFVYIRDDREEQEYFGLCEVEVFEYRSKSKFACLSLFFTSPYLIFMYLLIFQTLYHTWRFQDLWTMLLLVFTRIFFSRKGLTLPLFFS